MAKTHFSGPVLVNPTDRDETTADASTRIAGILRGFTQLVQTIAQLSAFQFIDEADVHQWSLYVANSAGGRELRFFDAEDGFGDVLNLGKGYLDIPEHDGTNDAAAPSDNKARLYVRDNGAGKEQLIVRFATGAVQVIATEP